MNWRDLIGKVEEWADDRGITKHSTPQAQLLKAVSEMGELCDAEIKAHWADQEDAIGDVLVCLIIYCYMKDHDLKQCLRTAYDEIGKRTGKMIKGGAFVKDE